MHFLLFSPAQAFFFTARYDSLGESTAQSRHGKVPFRTCFCPSPNLAVMPWRYRPGATARRVVFSQANARPLRTRLLVFTARFPSSYVSPVESQVAPQRKAPSAAFLDEELRSIISVVFEAFSSSKSYVALKMVLQRLLFVLMRFLNVFFFAISLCKVVVFFFWCLS